MLGLNIFLFAIASYLLFVIGPFVLVNMLPSLGKFKIEPEKSTIDKNNLKAEAIGTFNSFIIIFLVSILGAYLYSNDLTLLHSEMRNTPLYILSIIGVILFHDAYFYFTHLLFHRNKTLLKFHLYHHKSKSPTPMSVFSFHPVEGFVHFIFFIILCYLPIHFSIVLIFYVWMLLCNTFGHLNFEFYSLKIQKFKLTRNFNTATHHYMHHKYFNSNFGIYYNHWDKLFSTNHRNYLKNFVQNRLRAKAILKEQRP